MLKRLTILAAICALIAASCTTQRAKLAPANLRCEFKANPLGIDDMKPRLNWLVQSKRRSQKQTAYHILVASDKAILNNNQGDLSDGIRRLGILP